ncbi:MAG: alpha/beta fold hydrolase [Pseudomonadales bacterium]
MTTITQFVALAPNGERTGAAGAGALKMAYTRNGQGFPFVMVHGYTGSKLDFADQTESFEDIRTVITPDLRGHGETEQEPPYHLEQLTTDLLAFLEAADIPRCDLLGHSMGGMIAMRAAAQAPERFRSLILMDTAARSVALTNDEVASHLAEIVAEEGCQGLLPLMQMGTQSAAVERGIAYLGEAEHWRRVRLKLSQLDPQAFIDCRTALLGPIIDDAALASINCPTTILVGEQDHAFRKPAEHLLATLPNASLQVIAHAAHSPQYESHDAWRRCVRQHLEQVSL